MKSLSDRLADSENRLTLDGGLASEIERAGHDLDHPLWSARLLVKNPEAIVEVTRAFAEAGADLVATATYQASFEGLEKEGLDRSAAIELFRGAVRLSVEAIEAAGTDSLVAASIGPYGAYLADGSEYRGDYGLAETALRDFHRERLAVLADTEADLVAFETFPSGPEVRAVAGLMSEQHPEREAWISCSCRNGRELWDGTAIEDAAAFVEEIPQIVAFGVNCIDPAHAIELIERIREAAPSKAVIVYPNAGRGWDAEAGEWRGVETPDEFAEKARGWRKAGAAVVGGCCLTTPAHIRALAETVEEGK